MHNYIVANKIKALIKISMRKHTQRAKEKRVRKMGNHKNSHEESYERNFEEMKMKLGCFSMQSTVNRIHMRAYQY